MEETAKPSVTFPESLWKEGRKRPIDEGRDFQGIVRDALSEYLKRKKEMPHER